MKLISVFAVQVELAEEMVETEEEMKKELSGEFTRLKLFFSIFWEFTRLIFKCQLWNSTEWHFVANVSF